MAHMFPATLPVEVLNAANRSTEVDVYHALRQQLDDQYHVYYSSPWLGTLPDGSEIDGEADFLVAHAEKGILLIEVKGGRVEINSDDQWTSKDRHGFTRNIKNPVNQARSSKYNILEKLKASTYWNSKFICARHGVVLPHVVRPSRDFRPDMPLKLFAFDTDMKHLDGWVESRLQSVEDEDGRKTSPLGKDGLFALEDILSSKITLHFSLGTHIEQDLKEIGLKTDDQIFILREMEDNHRMAIAGAAGTGKTILAMEKALMLAREDKRVLLLCYNRPLGLYLHEAFADYPSVTVTHFHQYCKQIAEAAGVDVNAQSLDTMVASFIDNFSSAAIDEYDAVIIDEGQDFTDDWLTMLEIVVKQGPGGILYIFFDDNQNVMSTSASYIKMLPLAKHQLTRNFRNTKMIFEQANRFYDGSFVRPIGPEGNVPVWHAAETEAELQARIAERVGSLTKAEGVHPGEITILFSNTHAMKFLKNGGGYRVGRHKVTDAEHRVQDKPVVDTIRRFKGLESPVILLVLDRNSADEEELLYTGITRAQSILEVFGPKQVLQNLADFEQSGSTGNGE